MRFYDLEVMISNFGWVKLGVHDASVQVVFEQKISIVSASVYLRARAFEFTSDL